MADNQRFSELGFKINNLNAEIRDLSEKKWEIEDRIDALTAQVNGLEKEASIIRKAMWIQAGGQTRPKQVGKAVI